MKYKCTFCGYTADNLEDMEPDEQFHKGFWCPDCDGFTYFAGQAEKHSFLLMLEDKITISQQSLYSKPCFPTQVSPLLLVK